MSWNVSLKYFPLSKVCISLSSLQKIYTDIFAFSVTLWNSANNEIARKTMVVIYQQGNAGANDLRVETDVISEKPNKAKTTWRRAVFCLENHQMAFNTLKSLQLAGCLNCFQWKCLIGYWSDFCFPKSRKRDCSSSFAVGQSHLCGSCTGILLWASVKHLMKGKSRPQEKMIFWRFPNS